VPNPADRRQAKGKETAFQNDRTRLSCLTNSLSDDFLKKGGENRSEYEKASLERILTEVKFILSQKTAFFKRFLSKILHPGKSNCRGGLAG